MGMMKNEELARDFTIAMIPQLMGKPPLNCGDQEVDVAVKIISKLYKDLCEELKESKPDMRVTSFKLKNG